MLLFKNEKTAVSGEEVKLMLTVTLLPASCFAESCVQKQGISLTVVT